MNIHLSFFLSFLFHQGVATYFCCCIDSLRKTCTFTAPKNSLTSCRQRNFRRKQEHQILHSAYMKDSVAPFVSIATSSILRWQLFLSLMFSPDFVFENVHFCLEMQVIRIDAAHFTLISNMSLYSKHFLLI